MLQPNELRIGNAILIEIFPAPPQWHFAKAKDILDIADGRITLESISGIPLTPEVLERCGFAGDESHNDFPGNGLFLKNAGDYKSWWAVDVPLEDPLLYLHQLQNLVFALTGQELKISEK